MIVVADTTPLNYLILIGEIDLLPALYETILIPSIVHRELLHPKAPPATQAWASNLPSWCQVCGVHSMSDVILNELDSGERDAIYLALETGTNTVLLDDYEGRREAVRRHLHVTGTIALLEKAAQRGWIDFRVALLRLGQTNFRLSAKIRDEFLRRNS
jgi:predicted nucleic acid-binding protein